MSKEHLQQTLRDLHEELSKTEALDPELRAQLASLAEEIDDVLHPAAPPRAPEEESLVDRVRTARRHFEEDHPQLAAIIGRIADGLSQLGI